MVLTRRDVLKFVVFVVLIGLAVSYVSANREALLDGILGRSGGGAAETVPVGGTVPGGGEAVPVAALTGLEFDLGALGSGRSGGGEDYFVEFRLAREQARGVQLDLLREILRNPDLGKEAHERALGLWLSITEAVGREVDIENLIRAKGYADAVVILSEGKATILVKADSLTREEVICLADIAVRVAGITYEDITVVSKGG